MNIAQLLLVSGTSAALVLVVVLGLWLLSIRLRDVSIIDLAYGLLLGAVALAGYLLQPRPGLIQTLMLLLVWLWVLRYTVHIFRRNLGKGEDPRYTKLRGWVNDERAFNRLSLRMVFLHQGALIWLISLPVQITMASDAGNSAAPLAVAGTLLWATGFLIEALADRQLVQFRADPRTRGQILDTGLWRYSRHPNYFGDACVHWGLFLVACSVPWGWLGFVGPLAITYYLLNVTGVATLEKKMLREKPAYADYVRRTSRFVPWPPAPRTPS